MSFNLIVQAPDRVAKSKSQTECEAIAALPCANWIEITPSDSKSVVIAHVSINSHTPPKDVGTFFKALVHWATAGGYGLMDLQDGNLIDLSNPRDISVDFLPQKYEGQPCLMGKTGAWKIVVGAAGAVGSLREAANGDIRLIFGDDEASAVPLSWLIAQVERMRAGEI